MANKPRPDVSWVNPGATGTNKKKFNDAVQTISETTETRKEVGQGPSLIAAVGAKYGQNPTAAIARFKKSFIDAGVAVPDSWRASGGVTTKSNTVNKLYRPMGMK
jgi:hypothetical protein